MKAYTDHRGFTLTELLVATAIFALLMSAVAALFVASLNAMKSGYQSQEAFETARGAFNTLERDLNTVFTSRDFGQYYQFYGNEYGMMMVGLIRSRDNSGREYTRIGRVSYVIYPVLVSRLNTSTGEHEFFVTQPFAHEYARNVGISDVGLSTQGYYKTRGIRFKGGDPNSDGDIYEVCVAALVRYVEPGVSDLDSFPFDWNELADFYEGNPEFPPNNDPRSIRKQLNDSLEFPTSVTNPSSNPDLLARLSDTREQMFVAKKRDLWLRMLSCQEYWIPKLTDGAPVLPNIWGRRDPNTGNVVEPSWLNVDPNMPVNPRDYIIAENVGVDTPGGDLHAPLRPYRVGTAVKTFFEYGRVSADAVPELMPFWNANRFGYIDPTRVSDGIDNDFDGATDEADERVVSVLIDPVDTHISYVEVQADGIDNDGDGVVDERQQSYPESYPDIYRDYDQDGAITADEHPGESMVNVNAYGSPLRARLPEVVLARLPLVYSPAHFNAPNFERKMEQLIEIPTAYTRSRLGLP